MRRGGRRRKEGEAVEWGWMLGVLKIREQEDGEEEEGKIRVCTWCV